MEVNEKTTILIKALLDGKVIFINGEHYALRDEYEVCVRRESYNSNSQFTGYIWLKVFGDVNIPWYRKLATKLTEEQISELQTRCKDD